MLVCWYAAVLTYWYIAFIYWCTGMLLYWEWYIDVLVYLYIDMLMYGGLRIPCLIHILMYSYNDTSRCCCIDTLIDRYVGIFIYLWNMAWDSMLHRHIDVLWCIIFIFWCLDMLLHWYIDISICWCVDNWCRWHTDPMLQRCIHTLICCYVVVLIYC